MFPLIRSTGSKKQSRLAAHAPFSCRLTVRTSIPSNSFSQDSNRSYAKLRRALLSSFGEQSPLFSKGFPKKNAKLISQTPATPNLIEKCSRDDCAGCPGPCRARLSLSGRVCHFQMLNQLVLRARTLDRFADV